ncbi:MAG: DUF819 family protein [Saprospiraceae bacterium]|uniref:DUF819 family protein n=1 Tax=Candidatus Opimibacter skivensis TaxID=2982028 RepID=A0A9D7SXG9_9BACT|nr:DUF819 family protein [Candidatus Opimibacter skivensis]
MTPMITNDAVVLGILLVILASVYYTSNSSRPFWKKIYKYVPAILLCYFIPALLNWPLNLISGEKTQLYFIATRYLLPASLILFCLGVDLKSILGLGPKALIMFFASTFGVMIAAPLALLITHGLFPQLITVPADDLWKGLGTIAASWIGGGANQTAVKEIFHVSSDLFGAMVVIDVLVSNLWLAVLLYLVSKNDRINRWFKADTSAITALEEKVSEFRSSNERVTTTTDIFTLMAVAFGGVGLAHLGSDLLIPWISQYEASFKAIHLESLVNGFFWVVLIASTIGIGLSFTSFRKLEGVGASKWGSLFLYIMVATIGMQMNLGSVSEHLGLFVVGLIWISLHGLILVIVAKLIKAPFFFLAVGSQANIGGAASAPIVASAFNPALAPVGVLLAVLGLTIGTYGGLICAYMMQAALGL